MATFTIDSENNITGYAPAKQSRTATPNDSQRKASWCNWLRNGRRRGWSRSGTAPRPRPGPEIHRQENGRGAYLEGGTKPGVRRKHARRSNEARQVEEPTAKAKPHAARDGSKKADIIRLLARAKGATLEELMEATGWQAHSVRGFISGTLGKKLKMKIDSFRTDKGDRDYRVKG